MLSAQSPGLELPNCEVVTGAESRSPSGALEQLATFTTNPLCLSISLSTRTLFSTTAWQIARDVDGAGNYLMLTHKQVAQLHPLSGYAVTKTPPEWVLFHQFTIAESNCISVTSEISPEL